MKTVSQLNADGVFVGPVTADESPLEPGVLLLPAGAVDVAPPALSAGEFAQWIGGAWVVQPIPQPELPEPDPLPTLDQIKEHAIAVVRAARKPVFYTLAGMQSEALATGDVATATAIVSIQQALKALPDVDLSACTNQAEVDAAFVSAWVAIAQAAPTNVVTAFNEVLAA